MVGVYRQRCLTRVEKAYDMEIPQVVQAPPGYST